MQKRSPSIAKRFAFCILSFAAAFGVLGFRQGTLPADFANLELHTVPVQANVHMLHGGPAGNVAVQIGKDGVLLVDALYGPLAPRIAAEIKKITPLPIRYIVNRRVERRQR